MAKELDLPQLAAFLPENSLEFLVPFFEQYAIHLHLKNERKTILGDYRPPRFTNNVHRISININLNKYAFLIILLHEIAHLITYQLYGRMAKPHGHEWKNEYSKILAPFIKRNTFPNPIHKALLSYLSNPGASTCSDPNLYKILRNYDNDPNPKMLIDDLAIHQKFKTDKGRIFIKIESLRTRSKCQEISTGSIYLFANIYEVDLVV